MSLTDYNKWVELAPETVTIRIQTDGIPAVATPDGLFVNNVDVGLVLPLKYGPLGDDRVEGTLTVAKNADKVKHSLFAAYRKASERGETIDLEDLAEDLYFIAIPTMNGVDTTARVEKLVEMGLSRYDLDNACWPEECKLVIEQFEQGIVKPTAVQLASALQHTRSDTFIDVAAIIVLYGDNEFRWTSVDGAHSEIDFLKLVLKYGTPSDVPANVSRTAAVKAPPKPRARPTKTAPVKSAVPALPPPPEVKRENTPSAPDVSGKTVVLYNIDDDALKSRLEAMGAAVRKTISGKTDLVISNAPLTGKNKEACESRGVPVYPPSAF